MVTKIMEIYLPKINEIQLHKKRQGLKQKDMDVASYIEELKKFYLRPKIHEEESIKVSRYLSSLRWCIQEEITVWTPTTIH